MADETTVRDALSRIVDPARGTDILSANMVKGLSVKDGAVSFVLEVDPARASAMESSSTTSRKTGVSASEARFLSLSASCFFRIPAKTRKPRASRYRAEASPIPVDAPVMRTVLDVMGDIISKKGDGRLNSSGEWRDSSGSRPAPASW